MPLHYLKKLIPDQWKLLSKMRLSGGRWRLGTPDRVYLEDVILPWFIARQDVTAVLDIGVDWYTHSYPQLFQGKEYWTVDFDPEKSRFAGANHHTLSATEVHTVFKEGQFDLIICNGVFGWGLNNPDDMQKALTAFHHVLRPGGWLVVGWNDIPGRSVEHLAQLTSPYFSPFTLPATGASHFLTDTPYHHRYDYFQNS